MICIVVLVLHVIYGVRFRCHDLSSKAVKKLSSSLSRYNYGRKSHSSPEIEPNNKNNNSNDETDDDDDDDDNNINPTINESRPLTSSNRNNKSRNNNRHAYFDDTRSNNNNNNNIPKQIGILSHNVWCVFGVGGPNRRQRLKILIDNINENLNNIDIICLQEMCLFGLGIFMLCGDFEYIRDNLVKLGYIYYSDPKYGTPYIGSSNGTVIFSKYPMYNIYETCFNYQYRRFGRWKGYVSCIIKVENIDSNYNHSNIMDITRDIDVNNSIMIVNTHLEPFIANYKRQQINQLTNHIQNCINDSTNFIVNNSEIVENLTNMDNNNNNNKLNIICMGDFNICSNYSWEHHLPINQRLYTYLEESLENIGLNYDLFKGYKQSYRDMSQSFNLSKRKSVKKSKRKKNGNETIDHMFVTNKFENNILSKDIVDYKDNNNNIMSDHLGLHAIFGL